MDKIVVIMRPFIIERNIIKTRVEKYGVHLKENCSKFFVFDKFLIIFISDSRASRPRRRLSHGQARTS